MLNEGCKRILAIHDLSGFGHTSLMAEISIMYRLGIRVCALPTAVLSANTDYAGLTWVDMSPHLEPFALHWLELGLRFNAIHSGFLASAGQALQVAKLIAALRTKDTMVLVDPVLGDNGKLYSCYDESMIGGMRELVKQADVIAPNYWEAAWLAGADPNGPYDPASFLGWCQTLSALGPRHIVVTSVPTGVPGRLEVQYYNSLDGTLTPIPFTERGGAYPGAGDCFAAFVCAGVINEFSLQSSIRAAVEIMSRAIALDVVENADWREGIALEQVLQWDLDSFYRN